MPRIAHLVNSAVRVRLRTGTLTVRKRLRLLNFSWRIPAA
jgi:hypothetical protein